VTAWLAVTQPSRNKTYAIDDGTTGGYDWQAIGEAVSDGRVRMLKVPRLLLEGTARANLLLSSLFGYSPMLTPGKVRELVQPEWLCDNRDFAAVSGWKPGFNLKQGAQQLFK